MFEVFQIFIWEPINFTFTQYFYTQINYWRVPIGEYFMTGNNRNPGVNSRYWDHAFVENKKYS